MSHPELRPADAHARKLARTEFERPVVLEAGAGTGKTATLVARVLTWCLCGGWERSRAALGSRAPASSIAERVLERVALVTFTEKAAVEMERRVGAALAKLIGGGEVLGWPRAELALDERELRERAAALASARERLSVGTIHGFCRRVLAEHAVEAGLHPGFTVDADGRAVRAVCDQVVSERLARVYGEAPDEDWLALAERGHGPSEVRKSLGVLIHAGVEACDLALEAFPAERVAELVARFATATRFAARELGAIRGKADVAREVAGALTDCGATLAAAATIEDAWESALGLYVSPRFSNLKDYSRGAFNKTLQASLGERANAVRDAARECAEIASLFARCDPALNRAARAVLAPLLDDANGRLRRRGVMTFEHLLSGARDLLRDDPRVLERVRRSMDQLLVDEFQDTDAVQSEIVGLLALDGPRHERPGLFLVGDPKQSIYGWRSADLLAYERFVERVLAAGGELAPLHVNFRSSQTVLDEVEALIAPVMLRESGLQPSFEALLEGPRHEATPGLFAHGRVAIERWRPAGEPGQTLRAGNARAIEAGAIAADLARLRDAGVRLGECAILLRKTTQQETYLRALRDRGIPYTVGRDRHYFRTREVTDACHVVAALFDPGDSLALCVALRSPWVGVPDAALEPLWRRGLPALASRLGVDDDALAKAERAVREVEAALNALPDVRAIGLDRVAGWGLSACAFLRDLADLRRSFAREPLDVALEALRARLMAEECESARWLGAHRLANLERFFRELELELGAQGGGVHAMLENLRAGLAGERDSESSRPGDDDDGAVRVLTVHAAKGLEFAQVYVADLAGGARALGAPATEVERIDGRRELSLLGAVSLGWIDVERRREDVRRCELVRLFYVATTRAKDRLVLCGQAGSQEGEAATFADLAARRASATPGANDAAAEWTAIAAEVLDERAKQSGRLAAPSAGRVRSIAERFTAARDVAEQRSARALFAGPSRPATHESADARDARSEDAALERDDALAVGTAVHGALERWDSGASIDDALARALAGLRANLGSLTDAARLDECEHEARAVLESFARSALAERLRALAPRTLGRELPILVASDADDAPLVGWSGAADLVYEDASDVVVADFKTDRVDAAALEQHAAHYAQQGRVYVRAVERALGRRARFELWFLRAGRVVALDVS